MATLEKYVNSVTLANSTYPEKSTDTGKEVHVNVTLNQGSILNAGSIEYRLFVRFTKGLAAGMPTEKATKLKSFSNVWDAGKDLDSFYTFPSDAGGTTIDDKAFLIKFTPTDLNMKATSTSSTVLNFIIPCAPTVGFDFTQETNQEQHVWVALFVIVNNEVIQATNHQFYMSAQKNFKIVDTPKAPTLSDFLVEESVLNSSNSKYWIGKSKDIITLTGKVDPASPPRDILAQWQVDGDALWQSISLGVEASGNIKQTISDKRFFDLDHYKINLKIAEKAASPVWSNPYEVALYVDKTPPNFQNIKIKVDNKNLVLTGSVKDDESGLKDWEYSYDKTIWYNGNDVTVGPNLNWLIVGGFDQGFWVRATDQVGNQSSATAVQFDLTNALTATFGAVPTSVEAGQPFDLEVDLEWPFSPDYSPKFDVNLSSPFLLDLVNLKVDGVDHSLSLDHTLPILKDFVLKKEKTTLTLTYQPKEFDSPTPANISEELELTLSGQSLDKPVTSKQPLNIPVFHQPPHLEIELPVAVSNRHLTIQGVVNGLYPKFSGSISGNLKFEFAIVDARMVDAADRIIEELNKGRWTDFVPVVQEHLREFSFAIPNGSSLANGETYYVACRVRYLTDSRGADAFSPIVYQKVKIDNRIPALEGASVKYVKDLTFEIDALLFADTEEDSIKNTYEVSWDGANFKQLDPLSGVLTSDAEDKFYDFTYSEELKEGTVFSPMLRITSPGLVSIEKQPRLDGPTGLLDVTLTIQDNAKATIAPSALKANTAYDLIMTIQVHLGVAKRSISLFLGDSSGNGDTGEIGPVTGPGVVKVTQAGLVDMDPNWGNGTILASIKNTAKGPNTIVFTVPFKVTTAGTHTILARITDASDPVTAFSEPGEWIVHAKSA